VRALWALVIGIAYLTTVEVPAQDRSYWRYFSIDQQQPELSRTALNKLLNHLSWERQIVAPAPVDSARGIVRIDLRDYGWTPYTWERIVKNYPYVTGSNVRPATIRADWFIANASIPPLYHDILQLPRTLAELERVLSIDAEFEAQQGVAARFGLLNSGVSRNNRAVERHSTVYGAYWKSFDFSGNAEQQNVFRDPVNLRPDGGEVIFHLPNGLQGYFIADGRGRRIDEAPVNIVRDKTNLNDPVVRNGRSCIGCHLTGMNRFQDEVRATLQGRSYALFNIEHALELYPGQRELDRLVELDNKRFADAMRGFPASGAEPINAIARRYEGPLSVAQAATELFLQDPAQLQERIASSPELQAFGFDRLLGPRGGIKRDTWEKGFKMLAQHFF